MKGEINFSAFSLAFWLCAFTAWFFWGQSGWYRVDCSLGVEHACELIKAEYTKKKEP